MKISNADYKSVRTSKTVRVQLSHEEVRKIVDIDGPITIVHGHHFLTKSGAKLYPIGGGWFRLSGYHYNGQDVCDDLTALREPAKSKYVTAHALKFALSRRLNVYAGRYPSSVDFDLRRPDNCADWCKDCRHHVSNHETFQQFISRGES